MTDTKASRIQLILALATVYVVWGSTYLAIRFAVETLPPLLMAAARFLTAGLFLYGWCALRGEARPSARQWAGASTVGFLLLTVGNGLVCWAELTVPSGLAALLVATVPIWMVTIDGLRPSGPRPGKAVILGLVIGLLGVGILVGPGEIVSGEPVHLLGAMALLFASFSWAAGSILGNHLDMPRSPLQVTAMQMLSGGFLLALVGTLFGEWSQLDLEAVSLRSMLALGYLVLFGSILAFSAYVWLLRAAPPSVASTYAFVNPVVAVLLGWALADEALDTRTLLASGVIVTAVILITAFKPKGAKAANEAVSKKKSEPTNEAPSPCLSTPCEQRMS